MKYFIYYSLLLALVSCSRNPIDFNDKALEGPFPLPRPLIPYYEEASPFQGQQVDPENTPVDILFSIDNSGSMGPFIDAVQKNITVFTQGLKDSKVNFQMGILKSTENEMGSYQTSLFGPEAIVSSTDPNVVTKIQGNIQAVRNAYSGSDERPVWILVNGLYDNLNRLLFRPSSLRILMALTDVDNTTGATAEQLKQQFQSFNGSHRWAFTAIGNPTSNPCSNAESSQPLINELVKLTGGYMGRICDADYSVILQNTVTNILTLLNEFPLPAIPEATQGIKLYVPSLKVYVEGKEVIPWDPNLGYGYQYAESSHSIRFFGASLPNKGEKIEVTYEYWVP